MHCLAVPGSDLYYEVRGSGRLLLVVGQPMTSSPFGPLADLLAEHHTVVTYDPHGLGRSTLEDPSLDVTPDVQADDLARLVEAAGGGPADVFASSGGAVAGLALAVRHPHAVRTLIAHEPPVTNLLPDAPHVRAVVDDIEDSYRESGSGAAWAKFVSLVMHDGPVSEAGVPPATWPLQGQDAATSDQDGEGQDGEGQDAAGQDGEGQVAAGVEIQSGPGEDESSQEVPAPSEKQQADDELFFLHMLKPFTRYEPVVEALRSGGPRVVIGVGQASRGEVAVRSAVALATKLGTLPTTFPGDHGGFMADPQAFAGAIRQVLADSP